MLLHARGAASTASPLRNRAARAAGKTMSCAERWGAGGSLLMYAAIHHRMHGKCWGVTPWDTVAVGQTLDTYTESKCPQFVSMACACAENANTRWDKELAHCIWHHKAPKGAKGQKVLRKKGNYRYLSPVEGAVCWWRGADPGEAASKAYKEKEEGKQLVWCITPCSLFCFKTVRQKVLAKDRAWLSTDSGHAKHLALDLHSVTRIMFRNHSVSAHKGCSSCCSIALVPTGD